MHSEIARRFEPCPFCALPVRVVYQACPHCGRRARILCAAIHKGTLDCYEVLLWWDRPELAPPEYYWPPVNPETGERSPAYKPGPPGALPAASGTEGQTPEGDQRPGAPPLSVEARALAVTLEMLQDGETPTVTKVAKAARVNRTHLYTCKRLMSLLDAHRGDKSNLPRGRRDRDTGKLEAWRDDGE